MKAKFCKVMGLALLCVLLVSALGLSGCAKDSSSNTQGGDTAQTEKVLRVASNAYGIDLTDDPTVGGWNYWHLMYWGMGETLFRVGDNGAEPWLAVSSKKVDDTTFVVTLRDNVNYSSGNQMTAETVKACLERTEEANGGLARDTLDIVSMEAKDLELTIHTGNVIPEIESYLCNGIFCIYEMPKDDNFDTLDFTGCFVKGEYEPSVSRSLVRNEDYWGDKALLDEIQLICYEDTTASAMALQNGEVDFLQEVPNASLADFQNDKFKIGNVLSDRAEQFWFNEEHAVSSDSAVKHALAMCLDRDSIAKNFYYGMATPLYSIWGDQFSFGGSDGMNIPVTKQDIEGAKQLLADAGWADSDGDGILDKDGNRCSLTVVIYPYPELLSALDALTATAKTIGIEINSIVTQDYPSYEASGDFDVIWTSESTALVGTPYYYVNNFLVTGGSGNSGKFSNAEVDALAKELMTTTDEAKVADLCKQIEEIVFNDGHLVTYENRHINRVAASNVTFTESACDYYIFDNKTDIDVA